MCAAARLGARLGTFKAVDVSMVDAIVARWGLPVRARRSTSRAKIITAMSRDKKGAARFIVPVGWAKAKGVGDVPLSVVEDVLQEVGL
jgi:3-dehydroquinate synthetase